MNINELENDIVTVSELQVALSASGCGISAELTALTLQADTATIEGLWQLMQAVVRILNQYSERWTHVLGSSQTIGNREEAERVFNELSLKERQKFSVETLTNVDGDVKQNRLNLPPADGIPAYVVVTLIIGTADDKPLFDKINSAESFREVLQKVTTISEEYLMVFELLWSPQAENDSLTETEMMKEYAEMISI